MSYKISIIIPCYKQQHLLQRAIDSCIGQSYENLEIIVIDDGNVPNLLVEDFQIDERVTFVHQQNRGLSTARNTGIAHASGDYFKFLDSDDWLHPECIDKQVRSIYGRDDAISVVGYEFVDTKNQRDYMLPRYDTFIEGLFLINIGPPNIFLYPKECIEQLGGFSVEQRVKGGHEDYDFNLRAALAGYKAVQIKEYLACYYQHDNSMSTKGEAMLHTRRAVFAHALNELSELNYNAPIEFHLLWLLACYSSIKFELLSSTTAPLLNLANLFLTRPLPPIGYDKCIEMLQCAHYIIENCDNHNILATTQDLTGKLEQQKSQSKNFNCAQRNIFIEGFEYKRSLPEKAIKKVLSKLDSLKPNETLLLWGTGEICNLWLQWFSLFNDSVKKIQITATHLSKKEYKGQYTLVDTKDIDWEKISSILICSKVFYDDITEVIRNLEQQKKIINVVY